MNSLTTTIPKKRSRLALTALLTAGVFLLSLSAAALAETVRIKILRPPVFVQRSDTNGDKWYTARVGLVLKGGDSLVVISEVSKLKALRKFLSA